MEWGPHTGLECSRLQYLLLLCILRNPPGFVSWIGKLRLHCTVGQRGWRESEKPGNSEQTSGPEEGALEIETYDSLTKDGWGMGSSPPVLPREGAPVSWGSPA